MTSFSTSNTWVALRYWRTEQWYHSETAVAQRQAARPTRWRAAEGTEAGGGFLTIGRGLGAPHCFYSEESSDGASSSKTSAGPGGLYVMNILNVYNATPMEIQ